MNKITLDASAALANMQLTDGDCNPVWLWYRRYVNQPVPVKSIITHANSEFAYFQTQDEVDEAEQRRNELPPMLEHHTDSRKYIATDSGKNCAPLYSAFTSMASEMKGFLTAAREKGRPPFNILKQKFDRLRGRLPVDLQEEDAKVSIIFGSLPPPLGFIEDYVDYYLYLQPALNGEFETWRKNRVCEECGNIFFYKLDRAKFCSTQCQMKSAYKRRSGK